MRIRRAIAAAAVPLVPLVLLAACGDDDEGAQSGDDGAEQTAEPSTDAGHNEADVEFAQMMIPHHQQAVEMAALAPQRAAATEILDLAGRVQAAQDPEIEQMSGWLEGWGEQVPAGSAGHDMGGMDGEGGSGGAGGGEAEAGHGMMTAEDMAALEAASGAEFDRMFAEMMIEHHQGAVAMANDEIEAGRSAEAIELARAIVDAQQTEIAELQGFLDQAR
jgi:uncharacterized protein (DUF305 family)